MRVVVTGGAGAVGSMLCGKLLAEGHTVVCLDNLSTGSIENIKQLKYNKNFIFDEVDVGEEYDKVRAHIFRCDLVYHLAGSVGVMLVDQDPKGCLDNNLKSGQTVFEVAGRLDKKVVFTSTSEVYGNGFGGLFCESDNLIIGSPDKLRWSYASSKLTQEFLLKAHCKKYVIARLFNVVSGFHKKSYVIPSFVDKATKLEPLPIYGNGKAIRCYCDVYDAVQYLYRLGMLPQCENQIYNVGCQDNDISVKDLAEMVIDQINPDAEIEFVDKAKVFSGQYDDIDMRVPSTLKIIRDTGYTPEFSLEDIIKGVAMDQDGFPHIKQPEA